MRFLSSKSNIFAQTVLLSVANIFSMGIGFIIALVLPKYLGEYEYGRMMLATAIITFVSVLFEFGIFAAAANLLVSIREEYKKEVISISLKIFLIMSLLFSVTIYILSFFVDSFFEDDMGVLLSGGAWVVAGFLTPFVSQQLSQGSNQIGRLSCYIILGKILYVGGIYSLGKIGMVSANNTLLVSAGSLLVAFILSYGRYIFMRPFIFKNSVIFNQLMDVQRNFGSKNYYSRLVSTLSQQINSLILGSLFGALDVGLFALCTAMVRPLSVPADALVTSKFSSFGQFREIPLPIRVQHHAICLIMAVLVCLVAFALFKWHYAKEYPNGVMVALLCVLGAFFQALYGLYNNWIYANGLGKEMLVTGSICGGISLIGNFVFIYNFGIYGAGFTWIIVTIYALVRYLTIYNKHKRIIIDS